MEKNTRRQELLRPVGADSWLLPDSLWSCRASAVSPLYIERFKGVRNTMPSVSPPRQIGEETTLTSHGFWEFTTVLNGSGILVTDAHTFPLEPGSTVLTAPGVMHQECSSQELDTIWIGFEAESSFTAPGPVTAISDSKLAERVVRYWQFAFLRRPDSGLELDGRLLALLGYFLRVRAQRGGEESDPIRRILQYLQEHFAEPLNIPELAQELRWSENYFHRRFKASTGCTPARYLAEIRLKQVVGFLLHSALPLNQIAGLCGFSDPYYLSKAFRKRFGECPSEFRNRHRTE